MKKLVKDAAGHMVTPIVCRACGKAAAACPCGYIKGRCAGCCPGEPPEDVASDRNMLRAWRASKGQVAARAAVKKMGYVLHG